MRLTLPFISDTLSQYPSIRSPTGFISCVGEILLSLFSFSEFLAHANELLRHVAAIGRDEAVSLRKAVGESKPDAFGRIPVLQCCLKVCSKLLKNDKLKNDGKLVGMMHSQELAELLDVSLKASNSPEISATLFCCTKNAEMDAQLNSLKHQAWVVLNNLVDYSMHDDFKSLPIYAVVLSLANETVTFCVQTCTHCYSSEKGIDLENDKLREKALLDAMRFVRLSLEDNTFAQFCAPEKERLVSEVVLPCLRTTRKEAEDMWKDPSNFVALALDVVNQHSSKILKTEAAHLLEAVCEQLDGSMTFLTTFVASAVNLVALASPSTVPLANFVGVTPPEFLLSTCITAITVVSYLVAPRKDIMYRFSLFIVL